MLNNFVHEWTFPHSVRAFWAISSVIDANAHAFFYVGHKRHKYWCCTCSTDFTKYFGGPLRNDDVKSPNLSFWGQREHATENFHPKISRTYSFLGYFANNIWREQEPKTYDRAKFYFEKYMKMQLRVSAMISRLFQVIMRAKSVLSIMELNWNQRLRDKKTKLKKRRQMLTSSTQRQNLSFHVIERTKRFWNARAKRAKLLGFFVVVMVTCRSLIACNFRELEVVCSIAVNSWIIFLDCSRFQRQAVYLGLRWIRSSWSSST